MLGAVRHLIQLISRIMSWIAGSLTLVLMFLVVLEVALRGLFGSTIGGTIELSEVLLVFIVFTGVAYAQQVGGHVNTNLLTSRLPRGTARIVRTTGLVVVAVLLLWIAWASLARGIESMQAGEARFGIRSVPIWPARLVIPLGFLFLALETLFTAADHWRAGRPTEVEPPSVAPRAPI